MSETNKKIKEEDNSPQGVHIVTGSITAAIDYDPTKQIKRVCQSRNNSQQAILVFEGRFNGTTRIALKRYDKGLNDKRTMDQARKELELLSTPEKRHENIIRYFGHWDDDDFLYLATELCDCSVADIIHPNRTVKVNEEDYEKIMTKLSIKEILRQSTVAVEFIHGENIIHRNLHPDNFLIFGVEPNKDQYLIKLTDFQRYKNMTEILENTGTLNSEGWDAPENFPNSKEELSSKTDVFILGCYYFYVLSGGTHPFGSDAVDRQGMKGIKWRDNPIYIRNDWNGGLHWNPSHPNKKEAMLALNMIKSAIKFNPSERKSAKEILQESYFSMTLLNDLDSGVEGASMNVDQAFVTDDESPLASILQTVSESSESVSVPHINTAGAWTCKQKMRFNKKKEIYNGGNGILVYEGFFGGDQPAAVKRFQITEKITKAEVQREAELMLKANGHANILRYFDYEMDDDFLYLATEFCIGTLQHLVKGEFKTELGASSFFKNEKEILFQVTKGLGHLHSLNIIHKDVKPTNLLIYRPEGMAAVMKVADFGISKSLKPEQEDTTNSSKTNPSGTRGWISPEQYQPGRYSCKVDIFTLGLVFGYTLSDGGKHPYGEDIDNRAVLVKNKMPMTLTKTDLKDKYSVDGSFELIQSMLQMDPKIRPTAQDILKNAFFTNIQ